MPKLDRSVAANVPMLALLPPEGLDEVLSHARSVRFPKGANVFEQDADADSFFVLLHGHLRVMKVTPDGQQVVVRFVSPGELFGIAVAMGLRCYPATASAVEDSICLVWPSSSWPRLLEEHPCLAVCTLQSVGSRLSEAQTRIVEMSTEQVERRVAHAVLRLVKQSGRKVADAIEIDFPISRQDLAEMTGTTLHTVSRTLSAWEGRGLVEGGRQRIVVRNPHALFMLAEGARS